MGLLLLKWSSNPEDSTGHLLPHQRDFMSAVQEIAGPSERSPEALEISGGYASAWLSDAQESEWDAFVSAHPLGSLYHTTEWKAVIEQGFPHIRGRFLVAREAQSGRIRAGLPIYRVSSWLLGSRLASVPFATVCDPLVTSPEQWSALVPELQAERRRTRSNSLVIRAALNKGPVPDLFTRQSQFRHHSLALDSDFDTLSRSFDKSSVRQKAEKARRAGILIEERSDAGGMRISDSLLAMTRRRLCLPPMPTRFFAAMQKNLRPEHLKIFLAYENQKPVACHVILIFGDTWISEYSANADGAMSGVNQLLYLETIRQACAAGARKFSFGRTSETNQGLLAYKRRWGTVEEPLTNYTLREPSGNGEPSEGGTSSREASRMYVLCKRAIAKAPAPVCRMIGDFCYRHLG